MPQHNTKQRPHRNNHLNLPHFRYDSNPRSQHNHRGKADTTQYKRPLELLEDDGYFSQETDVTVGFL